MAFASQIALRELRKAQQRAERINRLLKTVPREDLTAEQRKILKQSGRLDEAFSRFDRDPSDTEPTQGFQLLDPKTKDSLGVFRVETDERGEQRLAALEGSRPERVRRPAPQEPEEQPANAFLPEGRSNDPLSNFDIQTTLTFQPAPGFQDEQDEPERSRGIPMTTLILIIGALFLLR